MVKIRQTQTGASRKQVTYRVTIPPAIAKKIDPEQEFAIEVTEDGILLRAVSGDDDSAEQLPSWMRPQST